MYKLITELYNVSCKIDGNMDSSYEPSVLVEDLSGSDSSKDSLPVCIYFYSLRKNIVDLSQTLGKGGVIEQSRE